MNQALLFFLSLFSLVTHAQTDSTRASIDLSEVRVVAQKFPTKGALPYQTELVGRELIAQRNPMNAADLLMQTGNVFVQKSQGGGGSPVLRGFEASRVLIVVDGVRMNNAIYRSGHLQNVLRIDPSMLDRAEVLFGPSSLIYGSDALGGVMYFQSRNPELAKRDNWLLKPTAYVRYGSATGERTGHVDVSMGNRTLGFLTSVTYGQFGDLVQGNRRREAYPTFGKLMQYVERRNNEDIIVNNPNPNRQVGSAYNQLDLLQKFLFRPTEGIQHVLNVQYSTTGNVPRYDRLSEVVSGKPRFAEWYYGPERRLLTSYNLTLSTPTLLYDRAMLTAAYQNITESRNSRRLGLANRSEQMEQVGVWSLNVDLQKQAGKHLVQYGLELTHNSVNSTARTVNLTTGALGAFNTRYPDGGSTLQTAGVYASDQLALSPKLSLNGGLRYGLSQLRATFVDKTFFPFPFNEIRQTPRALTGNLGLLYRPTDRTRLALLGSTGFRAPNVDDLTKVFDSRPGTLVIPNPNIQPEYTYNGEVSVSQWIGNWLRLEGTYYYTRFERAIVVDAFTFNGQSEVIYAGQPAKVLAAKNTRRATIQGWNVAMLVKLTNKLTLTSTLNGTQGRIRDRTNTPLDHIPPTFGRTALLYQSRRIQAEVWAMYNGWKRIANYNPEGEDNAQYATPDGMPAWTTLNARISGKVSKYLTLQAALENVMDQNYRYFASGISAPGRNLVLTVRGEF
ncbi:MAG: TonB-dependent receptor [Cytophagales bacterium]|nr:MAG: TonB-dependent receptor [Cytophagales bacterium]